LKFLSFFLTSVFSLNAIASGIDAESLFDLEATSIEEQVENKMWYFAAPCDTNSNGLIEAPTESRCVVQELKTFDKDGSNNWADTEITVFVKEVLKMPLFARTIAKEIIKRFDLNQNATLEIEEADQMVDGLKKPQNPVFDF
jgi:hypothetical protein